MGLKPSSFPHPRHSHVIRSDFASKLARTPVCGSIGRLALSSRQNLRFQIHRSLSCNTPLMTGIQTCQTVPAKPLFPTADVTAITTQRTLDRCERLPVVQHQN